MRILDDWYKDIPQQFLGKKNIEVLLNAFARQLQEVYQVLEDMKTMLDLDTATGQNLDYVGTIIPLSRKEAGELAGLDSPDPVMSDDRYRQFLRYQSLVNTNECTYYDLMEGLELLWNVSPIYYIEDPDFPATIILTMPFLKPGGEVVTLGEVPMVKPAGVRIEFQYVIRVAIEIMSKISFQAYGVPLCGQYLCGQYPRRGSIGQIIGIPSIVEADITLNAHDVPLAGTVRIGGKLYDATTGQVIREDILVTKDVQFSITDVPAAGQDVTGVYPVQATHGITHMSGIETAVTAEFVKQKLPLTGSSTAGGGQMEEHAASQIKREIAAEAIIAAVVAEPHRCGHKILKTVKKDEVARAVTVEPVVTVAKSKVSRCGNDVCGKK